MRFQADNTRRVLIAAPGFFAIGVLLSLLVTDVSVSTALVRGVFVTVVWVLIMAAGLSLTKKRRAKDYQR